MGGCGLWAPVHVSMTTEELGAMLASRCDSQCDLLDEVVQRLKETSGFIERYPEYMIALDQCKRTLTRLWGRYLGSPRATVP